MHLECLALFVPADWPVGNGRVERIWRREGLKVPQKQKPRGRLWLNDNSCVRLRLYFAAPDRCHSKLQLSCIPSVVMHETFQGPNWTENPDHPVEADGV
jgi:hypothetical protein